MSLAFVQSEPSFSELLTDPTLLLGLETLGIRVPTSIQQLAIPPLMAGHDLIAQAQTGSGKTLSFVLPILSRLRDQSQTRGTQALGTRALVLAPTRELAVQIRDVVVSLAADIEPACIIGGVSFGSQLRALRRDSRFVVGTPGRVRDLIQQRELVLRKCQQFVLDEADEMLSMGFLEEVTDILRRLPEKRQGMFFSATITPRVNMLARSFLREPVMVTANSENSPPAEIEHLFIKVGGGVAEKANSLCNLLQKETPKSAIIFCNTKSETELLEGFLGRRGLNAKRLNSDLAQKDRIKVMNSVRDGSVPLLIATDIAARGIDIEHVDLVVNYSIHDQAETYVHRTGRTGRAGRSGRAISLIAPIDASTFFLVRRSLGIDMRELGADA